MTALRSLQRQIHVGCKQLGIDNDLRHDLQLAATGKASMADMTETDLRAVLKALENRGFKPGFKRGEKRRHKTAERPDVRFIHVLWGKLGNAGALEKPGRDGLNAFIRSRFSASWGAEVIDVDALRDAGQINAVIRALKDWCKRAGVPVQ